MTVSGRTKRRDEAIARASSRSRSVGRREGGASCNARRCVLLLSKERETTLVRSHHPTMTLPLLYLLLLPLLLTNLPSTPTHASVVPSSYFASTACLQTTSLSSQRSTLVNKTVTEQTILATMASSTSFSGFPQPCNMDYFGAKVTVTLATPGTYALKTATGTGSFGFHASFFVAQAGTCTLVMCSRSIPSYQVTPWPTTLFVQPTPYPTSGVLTPKSTRDDTYAEISVLQRTTLDVVLGGSTSSWSYGTQVWVTASLVAPIDYSSPPPVIPPSQAPAGRCTAADDAGVPLVPGTRVQMASRYYGDAGARLQTRLYPTSTPSFNPNCAATTNPSVSKPSSWTWANQVQLTFVASDDGWYQVATDAPTTMPQVDTVVTVYVPSAGCKPICNDDVLYSPQTSSWSTQRTQAASFVSFQANAQEPVVVVVGSTQAVQGTVFVSFAPSPSPSASPTPYPTPKSNALQVALGLSLGIGLPVVVFSILWVVCCMRAMRRRARMNGRGVVYAPQGRSGAVGGGGLAAQTVERGQSRQQDVEVPVPSAVVVGGGYGGASIHSFDATLSHGEVAALVGRGGGDDVPVAKVVEE